MLLFFKRVKDILWWRIKFWLSKLPHLISSFISTIQQNLFTNSNVEDNYIEVRLSFYSNTADAIYKNWNTWMGNGMCQTFGNILNFTNSPKTPVPEPLFLKKRPATLFKQRLWHRYFAVNFAKFLRTIFYRTPLGDCFCFKQNLYKNHRLKFCWCFQIVKALACS